MAFSVSSMQLVMSPVSRLFCKDNNIPTIQKTKLPPYWLN